ncbi:polyADP-ribose polymerase PARP8 [Crotalus adamanteus]|uniref:PolyADP-ribose polymerase PARP8 n=1 Tax=Crotalus adamanteus TaxID=8729 RepID=A0AAW1C2I2_CROAD
MGMCSRQDRIQKDIDIVIQKCKAEKDCLFADFRYADSTFTFTYVGGSKSWDKSRGKYCDSGLVGKKFMVSFDIYYLFP